MEFYNLEHIPTKQTNANMYYNFGLLAVQIVVILWYFSYAFDWCRDPLANKLQEMVDKLEDENYRIKDYMGELETALEDRDDKIEHLENVISELWDVLNNSKRSTETESDSDSSDGNRKRRRED